MNCYIEKTQNIWDGRQGCGEEAKLQDLTIAQFSPLKAEPTT